MKAIKKKLSSSKLRVISSTVQLVLVLFLALVAFFSFSTRIPALSRLGFNFFAITSGSMEPAIPVGSLVYIGSYNLKDLKVEDIITFRRGEDTGEPIIVTHRIEKINRNEQLKVLDVGGNNETTEKTFVSYEIITKGDANNASDPNPVPPGNIIGLYKWHIPQIGYLTNFAQTINGFILLVIVPSVILIGWELISLAFYIKNYYEAKSKKEIEKMKKELSKKKRKNVKK